MPNYSGFLFSPTTAKEECSYCGNDLLDVPSLKLEGEDQIRFICVDCFIRVLDAIAKPE